MNTPFSRGMSRATELTRSGKLDEATVLIWSLFLTQPVATQDPDQDAIESASIRGSEAARTPPSCAKENSTGENREGHSDALCGATAPLPPDSPTDAQFLSLAHSGKQGRRDYLLYIPANQPAGPMPLVVMLHGCTQSPEDFATGTGMNALAEEFGCLIAWPVQTQGANVQKCWNWFRLEDQARNRGEPALIAGIVRDILREHLADPTRVYVAGLSAGGAAAAVIGAAYPDLFAAVGVHSGLPIGGAQDVSSAFAAMRSGAAGKTQTRAVPAIVFHGLADTTVHPANGDAIVAQALKVRSGLERVHISGTSDGGRTYRQTCHNDTLGRSVVEHWEIDDAGHAWAGGQENSSYTDPEGPDASREMLRFFLQHTRA